MKLTNPVIKAAKPQEKDFTLSDGNCLSLLIRPNGAKLWRFRYRFNGKPCSLSLGAYPDVTLQEARLERDRLKKLIKQGINPSVQRQEDKFMAAKSLTNSFESVARDWFDSWQGTQTPAHATRIIRRLEADVFPML
ncbi:MAG: Arm DNA-binding domain-containing protein, partial [Aquaspirillum sp.]